MHHHSHHHFLMSFLFLPETRIISIIHSRPPLPLIRPSRSSALKPLTLTSESSHPLLSKAPKLPARKPRIGPKPRHHDHRPVTPQMPVAYTTPSPTSVLLHTQRKKTRRGREDGTNHAVPGWANDTPPPSFQPFSPLHKSRQDRGQKRKRK
ncbi:hypothetical protein HDV57DRAFT_460840 [Trichoderma longibrachiatum]|uniref:Uncharacterized protein n=1 Tax=Trichoderma longibrachiatum ATCC 18648 TaxID=983965 RepID=A0A2T4C573_TRILO|nr:hypothetical protein M440DRAFT_1233236 [Trichoderma longibrachiatum ATCC 18648]